MTYIITLSAVALVAAFFLALPATASQNEIPAVGQRAPDVTLADQDGDVVTLSDLWADGPLVIYFYPKDFTPGCTAQACSLRDGNDDLRDAGVEVVGISFDTVASHRKFADRHRLSFTLLADPEGVAAHIYGVSKRALGFEYARRVTFLVDRDGVVRHVWDPAATRQHAEEVLAGARELGLAR